MTVIVIAVSVCFGNAFFLGLKEKTTGACEVIPALRPHVQRSSSSHRPRARIAEDDKDLPARYASAAAAASLQVMDVDQIRNAREPRVLTMLRHDAHPSLAMQHVQLEASHGMHWQRQSSDGRQLGRSVAPNPRPVRS